VQQHGLLDIPGGFVDGFVQHAGAQLQLEQLEEFADARATDACAAPEK
jgi:hypothetical protein